jgi:hypothetical protein
MLLRIFLAAFVLAVVVLPASAAAVPFDAVPSCVTLASVDDAEAPCNPFLADSPWAGNHRNSYAQASSPMPAPVGPAEHINVDKLSTPAVPVIVSFSPAYPDGKHVLWASTVGVDGEVLKVDTDTMFVIDKLIPSVEQQTRPSQPGLSGAYNLVDADNRLFVGLEASLVVYGDALPGVRLSPIAQLASFELPASAMCGDDRLVGINMTYDGRIAFATQNGIVGTIPRDPDQMTQENLVTVSLNGDDCSAGPDGVAEEVSNSIATDENGGIYVVTSRAMYRVDSDGDELAVVWRAGYGGAGNAGAGRIGPGSGSTPSLMGTAPEDDRFVVITDSQDLMHLVLMWRDEIPVDWQPVRAGADRRIACEIPVTFGDPDTTESLSEQSVLVRGHSAVVVNDKQPLSPVTDQLPAQLQIYSPLLVSAPGSEPRGIEKYSWDSATRTCGVDWSNPDVPLPNGIPSMSTDSNLIYAVGIRDSVWTLEGIDFTTGEEMLSVPMSSSPTTNSTYAAATIGPGGTLWTGTFGGIVRFQPCDPVIELDCGRRLSPDEALIGTFPNDPVQLLQHFFGIPNGEPGEAAPDKRDAPFAVAPRQGSDGDEGPTARTDLAATGGGAALAAALALGLSATTRRRRRD